MSLSAGSDQTWPWRGWVPMWVRDSRVPSTASGNSPIAKDTSLSICLPAGAEAASASTRQARHTRVPGSTVTLHAAVVLLNFHVSTFLQSRQPKPIIKLRVFRRTIRTSQIAFGSLSTGS